MPYQFSLMSLDALNTVPALPAPPTDPHGELMFTSAASPNGLVSAGSREPGVGLAEDGQWLSMDGKSYTLLPASLPTGLHGHGQPAQTGFVFYGVSDSGEVVGQLLGTGLGVAYLNGHTTVLKPAGATTTVAWGVNTAGEVVGSFNSSPQNLPGATHGFTYINGQYTQIDYPGGTDTAVFRVSNTGELFGATTINGVRMGFTADVISPAMTRDMGKMAFLHTADGHTDHFTASNGQDLFGAGKIYSDAANSLLALIGNTATSYSLKQDMLSLFDGNRLTASLRLDAHNLNGLTLEHNAMGVQFATAGHDVFQPGGVGVALSVHG